MFTASCRIRRFLAALPVLWRSTRYGEAQIFEPHAPKKWEVAVRYRFPDPPFSQNIDDLNPHIDLNSLKNHIPAGTFHLPEQRR